MEEITIETWDRPIRKVGTVLGEVTHGYDLPCGSWSLFPIKGDQSTPAVFLIFRPYKKHKPIRINKKYIISRRVMS